MVGRLAVVGTSIIVNVESQGISPSTYVLTGITFAGVIEFISIKLHPLIYLMYNFRS